MIELWAIASGTAQPAVVVSQVYGGGGDAGSTWRNDFIEIFNTGATAVDLTGWSVQYTSTSFPVWQVTPLAGAIPAHGYYLIREASAGAGTTDLPTPDALGTIAMSRSMGTVALVSSTTALSGGTCPVGSPVLDLVGYGLLSCAETDATGGLDTDTAAIRREGGCIDSGDNSNDFGLSNPLPRNSAEPPHACGVEQIPLLPGALASAVLAGALGALLLTGARARSR